MGVEKSKMPTGNRDPDPDLGFLGNREIGESVHEITEKGRNRRETDD